MIWPWPAPRRGDIVAILFVLGIAATLIASFEFRSSWNVDSGFGPDWTCTDAGDGEPVCIKKIPVNQEGNASNRYQRQGGSR